MSESIIRKALEFYANPEARKNQVLRMHYDGDGAPIPEEGVPLEADDGNLARKALAALEHAEVMWRVRYSDGDASEPYEDFSQAEWLSAANAEDGMSNTLERVLVIREEAE